MLDKAAIFAAPKLQSETVPVAEWGGDVTVREMTGEIRDGYEKEQLDRKEDGRELENFKARLLVRCLFDGENRLFEIADAAELGKQPASIINRLFEIAVRLNGLSESKKN